MAERTVPRIYADSCVFLSYVNGIAERLPDIDALLDAARREEVEIITSAVSKVEVAFGKREQDGRELLPDIEDKIDALWRLGSPVRLVEFHEAIAEGAKRLMRTGVEDGLSLKPMDAIHLATARHMDATEFVTYDTKLERYSESVGMPVRQPTPDRPHLPWGTRDEPTDATPSEPQPPS